MAHSEFFQFHEMTILNNRRASNKFVTNKLITNFDLSKVVLIHNPPKKPLEGTHKGEERFHCRKITTDILIATSKYIYETISKRFILYYLSPVSNEVHRGK